MQYDFTQGKWYQDTRGGKNYTIPNDIYGKPLVLVPGLDSKEENRFKHGFAEAAGDRLFASLVQLDQSLGGSVGGLGNNIYDATGKLIRKPGAIFKSPLHFIGFGQGATINSEAIQRLGTFFPNAYDGSSSGDTPELQMTTIDTPDPTQERTRNLYDPEVKIWENVTFADNYYQKATFNGNTVFSGLNLPDADLNVFLGEPSNSESRNWVSWEVNESWLSEEEFKRPGFIPDPELNETGWYQVKDGDYGENDRTKLPDGKYLAAGHMTAAEDRTKSKKDFIATFVTTNILPQHPQNNGGPWKSLEGHLRSRAKLGSDFTVFAGGAGTLADFPSIEVGDKKNTEIQVPSHIWKVVIARNLGDPIDLGRDAYAVIMPNENIAGQEWTEYRYSIQQLQDWLALDPKSPKYLDFLSGIKDDAQRNKLIKANKNSSPPPALT